MNRLQLMRRAVGVTATATVLVAGLVGAAHAQSPTTQVTPDNAPCGRNGTNQDPHTGHALTPAQIRNGSSTTCSAIGAAQPSDTLDYFCWTEQGLTSFTWTFVRDTRTNVHGWIRDDLLSNHGSTVNCGF